MPHNGLLLHLLPQQAVGRSVGASCMDGFALDAGDSLAASQSQLALHLVKRLQQTVATTKLPPTQLAGGSDRIGSSSSGQSGSLDQFTLSLSLSVCARCN